jgi:hypothetical protein
MESVKLQSHIATLASGMKKQQAILTQLIAQCVYQSIAGNNADPGIKLIGALSQNGYSRRNDTITYLCKMGNFGWKKDKGLFFKANFEKNEETAIKMAEMAISNPMFTIEREKAVKTEIDILADIKNYVKRIKKEIAEAAKEGRALKVQHEEILTSLEILA